MAEEPVSFGISDARRIDRAVGWYERNVIDARDPRKRQQFSGGSAADAKDEACGCCDCFDCLPPGVTPITGCVECADGASGVYFVNVGTWAACPLLGGLLGLIYDSGCTWKSLVKTFDGGTYRWELVQAGTATTLTLVWVSGDDPLNLEGGDPDSVVHEIVFTAFAPWSCRCSSKMTASNPDKFYSPSGLNCTLCVYIQHSTCECCLTITTTGDYVNTHFNEPELTGTFEFYWYAAGDPEAENSCYFRSRNSDTNPTDPNWSIRWDRDTNTMSLKSGTMADPSEAFVKTLGVGETPCGTHVLTDPNDDTVTVNVIDCDILPPPADCGTCAWVWCAATGEINPVPGVSCGDEPRYAAWAQYSLCDFGGITGTCTCPEPEADGAYHGEMVLVACPGEPA